MLCLPSSLHLDTFLFFYLLNTCLSFKTQLKCLFFHKAFLDHPFEIIARWTIYLTFMLLYTSDVCVNVSCRDDFIHLQVLRVQHNACTEHVSVYLGFHHTHCSQQELGLQTQYIKDNRINEIKGSKMRTGNTNEAKHKTVLKVHAVKSTALIGGGSQMCLQFFPVGTERLPV